MATKSHNTKARKSDVQWSERHKPRHLGEVVGNTDQVRKIAEWLRDWDEVVLKGKKKEMPQQDPNKKFFQAPDNMNARACLVSGPPGIGKTTTCSLVARCNTRYKLMEFNASDARSKAVVDAMSNSLAGNRTLKFGAKANESNLERAVIIMDECDGMAGGGDKGGMQALINLIKTTKNPVICICNDRNDQNVRNLASHCLDLRFKRPDNIVVAKRIKGIMESQGKRVDLGAVESIVEGCGQDIRQVINHVQFFGSLAGSGRSCQKDTQLMLSPFDAAAKLLSVPKDPLPMNQRMDLFYNDSDMVPLLVQENYLRPLEKRPGDLSEAEVLERAARASDLIAMADTMGDNFEVTSSVGIIGSIYPSYLMTSQEAFTRPTFPTYLQKRGGMTKASRVVQEMSSRIKASTTCGSKEFVTCSYHDVLYRRCLKPLQMGNSKDCAQLLNRYGLTRDFFTDQAPAIRQPLQLDDGYKKVEGKHKVSLLQEINDLVKAAAPVKRKRVEDDGAGGPKRRGKTGAAEEDHDAEEDGDEDTAPAAAEDDDDIPGLVKKMTTKGGAKSKAAKTNSNSKVRVVDMSKNNLNSWKVKKAGSTTETDVRTTKDALLVLRFIEGHTNAVRRKVHMSDLLGAWKEF
eukprot:TRINITY_DN7801_c0_g1_i2.p1 TRINITY_DN7801_c0_g1~~TRINITY_DN7801_c0_g1_i2.p1  ORF type:complete len:641 (-),score=143.03 TRINITY_DN7801_c0_g1_i2:139-2025(-)